MAYHCPSCGSEISFGESICPNCNEDVTGLWERMNGPRKAQPKVLPGMGGMEGESPSPFPSPGQANASPFPPNKQAESTPFPPNNQPEPFPPSNLSESPPFPSPNENNSPFPSPAMDETPQNIPVQAQPFPPANESTPFPPTNQNEGNKPYFEIPRIGGKLIINQTPFRVGRNEIKEIATKDLPDLNAYKNISRKRAESEHFIIHEKNGNYLIEDIHSTNGTYLGTTKLGPGVPPQQLKNGDKIIVPIEEFGKMVQLEIFFKLS